MPSSGQTQSYSANFGGDMRSATASDLCPCGTGLPLSECCGPHHAHHSAPDAERLMRSRYAAYVLGLIDYLRDTTLPAQQTALDMEGIRQWSQSSHWLGLEVEAAESLDTRHAKVRFKVRWQDPSGAEHLHQECSSFVCIGTTWYFIDPTVPLRAGRNDPCPCQSGQKLKKCCGSLL